MLLLEIFLVWGIFCAVFRLADYIYSAVIVNETKKTLEIRRLLRRKKIISVNELKRWTTFYKKYGRFGHTEHEVIRLYYGKSKLFFEERFCDEYDRFITFLKKDATDKQVERSFGGRIIDDTVFWLTIL